MGINLDELGKKLHQKLDSGIDQLKSAQSHLADVQNETESAIHAKLDAAKQKLEGKKEEALAAKEKADEYLGDKKADAKSSVAEWKAERNLKKLEKHAERAENHAESCIAAALYYAGEAEVAILEALAARQDAEEAM